VAEQPSPFVFERTVVIAAPIQRVFGFHLDPDNLRHLNPPGVRTIRLDVDRPVRSGSRVVVSLQLFGILRQDWTVVIAEVVQGVRLVDVAESGPFSSWRHEHRIEVAPGGTRLTDRIEFVPKGGRILGTLGAWWWRPQLAFLFWWRHRVTRRLLESTPAP
jgi:ligand-binding SRPBCC domain-containing protein